MSKFNSHYICSHILDRALATHSVHTEGKKNVLLDKACTAVVKFGTFLKMKAERSYCAECLCTQCKSLTVLVVICHVSHVT